MNITHTHTHISRELANCGVVASVVALSLSDSNARVKTGRYKPTTNPDHETANIDPRKKRCVRVCVCEWRESFRSWRAESKEDLFRLKNSDYCFNENFDIEKTSLNMLVRNFLNDFHRWTCMQHIKIYIILLYPNCYFNRILISFSIVFRNGNSISLTV